MSQRYLGIDIGAETIKLVEVVVRHGGTDLARREIAEHGKQPARCLMEMIATTDWKHLDGAAVSGRFSRRVLLPRIPTKTAQAASFRFLHGDEPATVVSIGSHGFSVLEIRGPEIEVLRENGRCSQGTGSFLRQLVERFDLSVEEASRMVEDVADPAPLSGRCPVILKTDMTHLANKGECRAGILAGLYDALCENVEVLIKPRVSPSPVLLIGGVSRARRIHDHFASFLQRHGMALLPSRRDDALFFEALGCALVASRTPAVVPDLEDLLIAEQPGEMEVLPALSSFLRRVKRMDLPPATPDRHHRQVILGLDIGSTGSKAVALDTDLEEVIWEAYQETRGDPVSASQALVRRLREGPAGRVPVLAVGVTGSGREIVGSLLTTCYGSGSVFVLNEIAAHATGAVHHEPRVDTIFEIGGQDAKYIRLDRGRVVDAAMNEACSAGTGSFIAEQGKRFSGIRDVVHLGDEALTADQGVSLGQHCSVFMAEVIDEAIARGVPSEPIIAGLYDSVIQNYLNRVKGNRGVGRVVFCQGMPFSAPALAAAVARQTGSEVVVPSNPGTIGALGISLLTLRNLAIDGLAALRLERFLATRLERKDTFVCKSTDGCSGSGNRCRIDRIQTRVNGRLRRFTWGGACSLWDKANHGKKLPDRSPDPFRQREELVAEITKKVTVARGRPRVALTDEFALKGLFPFFATFLYRAGFDLVVRTGATREALKRGIESANVSFCAPMQQYHGLVSEMAEEKTDYLFLPMLRSLPRVGDETHAVTCPISQGSPQLLRWDLGGGLVPQILAPVIDFGRGNLRSEAFRSACRSLADELSIPARRRKKAFDQAVAAQQRFDAGCLDLGRAALAFCREQEVVPVVVLGRAYTIYNTVLNSNVPAILREQGVLPIPVDCYPVLDDAPVFHDVYWGYGQRNLRAAHDIRRTPGVFSLFCSNYACGPDAFNLHFYSYIMEGKPFAVIETDGHSGDAGTKTRVEAFLYCAREALASEHPSPHTHSLKRIERAKGSFEEARRRGDTVLLPRLSESATAIAACLRGVGLNAECLPVADREALRLGRRHTSGKECLPMCLTMGSFLQRIRSSRVPGERFTLLTPTARGPCRFGVYNVLQKIIVEQLGMAERVTVWSPSDRDYFVEEGAGFAALAFSGLMAVDMLSDALRWVRPVERSPGLANKIFLEHQREMIRHLERVGRRGITASRSIREVVSGHLFGCGNLLRRAGEQFLAAMGRGEPPTVLLVGEIYIRLDPGANDSIIERLEERGLRVKVPGVNEWLEYTAGLSLERGDRSGLGAQVSHRVQGLLQRKAYAIMAETLGWPRRTSVGDTLGSASGYIRRELTGEAALTLGGPLHEWRLGEIDGAISVGPLECMPNKLSESQFFHIAEQEGLKTLTLGLTGEPIDPEVLDNFVFEVREGFESRRRAGASARQAWSDSNATALADLSVCDWVRGAPTPGFGASPGTVARARLPVLK